MNTKSCFAPAHILLPSAQIPLEKWGCIACDQFTSDRDYWQKAEAAAAGSPSTLNLILPEVYLEDGDADARIEKIHATMDDYSTERADPRGGRLYLRRAHRAERQGAAGPCGHGGSGSLQLPPGREMHGAPQREHRGKPHPAPHEGAHRRQSGNAPHHDAGR